MVNKFLLNLAIEYGSRVGKSVYNAYTRVVSSGGGAASQSGFGKAASSTIGRFIAKPMTREEACQILSLEERPELNHVEVMEVSRIYAALTSFYSVLKHYSIKITQRRVARSTCSPKYTLQRSI